jgi:hypothetical protein
MLDLTRKLSASLMTPTRVALLTLAFGTQLGCGGGTAPLGLGLGLIMLAWPFARSSQAGAPMPCDKRAPAVCSSGYIQNTCCAWDPSHPHCKAGFKPEPFVSCGSNLCVEGNDPGRCPAPLAAHDTGVTAEQCNGSSSYGGGWQPACIDRKVKEVCIPPVPTNYTGPAQNPPYRTCGGDRCTTHTLMEDCFPAEEEALSFMPLSMNREHGLCLSSAGPGTWKKVCLGGKVDLRCVPRPYDRNRGGRSPFVSCPDGSCAVGPSPELVCPK